MPPRFFVGHSIYKGKAALTVEPKAPEFTPLDVFFFFSLVIVIVLVLYCAIKPYGYDIKELIFPCSVMVMCLVQSGAFKVSREGFVLLQFAPAAGVRQYDWSRKQVDVLFCCFGVNLITDMSIKFL